MKAAKEKSRSRWGWWWRLWEKLQGWWLLVVVRYLGLGRPRSIPSASDSFHKILCLGDGTVEGWGDVWRLGRLTAGFPARLQDLLDETDKHWVVINRGHYGATTDDWLPDAAHKASSHRARAWRCGLRHGRSYNDDGRPSVGPAQWVKRTLWCDVMDDPNVNDAEVVLLGLGSMDNLYGEDPKSASHTVDNFIAICSALKDLRKLVFVSPIPAGREVERGHKRRNLERNVLLWEFLQAQQQQQQQQLDSSHRWAQSTRDPAGRGDMVRTPLLWCGVVWLT
ncbi:AMP-dependent synthetase and ligase [Acanthamoeba castellanii str. Neff]|uniref:AMP-dependent synthetase and ligase n=1 Tax=Acanthamoeba castellanii (strain ATCC 30010 / Neff) TaxID=1257118 RepID=L8HJN3_ACACF|nr:AMP-dependent synthetase and ligase [Acanthamoeba castellanii str. Neff]ELR25420.1 AMP-dependent synthetase and ligase [Acanthamoeba castellanii str. Neff]